MEMPEQPVDRDSSQVSRSSADLLLVTSGRGWNGFDPLGARLVLRVLERWRRHVVLVQDRLVGTEEILQIVRMERFQIIWMSVQVASAQVVALYRALRQVHAGPVIAGNVGAEILSLEAGDVAGPNHIVVRGSGEDAVDALCQQLVVKAEGEKLRVAGLPNARVMRSGLDDLNFATRSVLAHRLVPATAGLGEAVKRGDLISARSGCGCTGKCSFCSSVRDGRAAPWQPYSLEALSKWLEAIPCDSESPCHLRFVDEDLVADLSHFGAVCEEVANASHSRNVPFVVGLATRASGLMNPQDSPEVAKRRHALWTRARECGVTKVFIGVETDSSSQLMRFGKATPRGANRSAVQYARSLGLSVEIGLIALDPEMALATWKAEVLHMVHFVRQCNPEQSCPTWLAPVRVYGGTSLARRLAAKGLLGDRIVGTLEYAYRYECHEVAEFARNLGPALCAGVDNGMLDLKRWIKNFSRYSSLRREVMDASARLLARELEFVEGLLRCSSTREIRVVQQGYAKHAEAECLAILRRSEADEETTRIWGGALGAVNRWQSEL